MDITWGHTLVNKEQGLKSKTGVGGLSVCVCVNVCGAQHLPWDDIWQRIVNVAPLMSAPAFILGTVNSRGTKQNRKPAYKQDLMASASFCQSYAPKNTLPAFTPSPPWHKTRSSPATPTDSGIYFCLRAYKIDSYASAPDLKCSEGLRVRIVPLLCTEGEKKKEKRWWWLDWTHSNWWVPWPEAWVCMGLLQMCVCMLLPVHARSVQTKSL